MLEFIKKYGFTIILTAAVVSYVAYVGTTGQCPSCLLVGPEKTAPTEPMATTPISNPTE